MAQSNLGLYLELSRTVEGRELSEKKGKLKRRLHLTRLWPDRDTQRADKFSAVENWINRIISQLQCSIRHGIEEPKDVF